ncbi:MAG: tetraacyldisaccharide 4'-kinase, partial [Amoebophilaceae bacterium]|nr:tetraacyldisaccharide 4'-kinase [Amoebophilaceae bacterium]
MIDYNKYIKYTISFCCKSKISLERSKKDACMHIGLYIGLKILSWCYGVVIIFRNFIYDHKLKKSCCYKAPKLIGVGNLSVGGTGKTPLVIYLTQFLAQHKAVAILSKGYKRLSKGFKIIHKMDSALTAGDEPYLYYTRFKDNPNVMVVVCENRTEAISRLMQYRPTIKVILLDDAFQDRSIIPTLNILLTTSHHPFFNDHLLPLGLLREPRKEAKRADMIIITKNSNNPSKSTVNKLKTTIKSYHPTLKTTELFFTRIIYKSPIQMWGQPLDRLPTALVLVTGIANPLYLQRYLTQKGHQVTHLTFNDHHWFSYRDILKIYNTFQALNEGDKAIV